MFNRIMLNVSFVLMCCFTLSACTNDNQPFEEWKKNEFFGLNLDKDGQVAEFHKLLLSGKLDWNGTKLEEWTDGFGSDYELTEGRTSTTCVFQGSAEDARSLFERVDSILYNRYNNCEPLKQKEWTATSDGIYSMSYVNFYNYKGYRIGVTMVIESPEKDESKANAGSVRIGLGALSLPENSNDMRESIVNALNNEDWNTSVYLCEKVIADGDTLGTLTVGYAEALCYLEKYKEASVVLKQYCEEYPNDYMGWQSLACAYHLMKDYSKAIECYDKTLKINPYYARPYINLADIYTIKKNTSKAVESYIEAIDLFYSHDFLEETEHFSKEILKLDDKNPEAYVFLALVYYKQNNTSDFEKMRELAIKYGGEKANRIISDNMKKK